MDKILEYRADVCPHCHFFPHESMGKQLPPIERHQVWELPEIRPHITEHRLLSGWCPLFQVWVKPDLPVGVARSDFGPRLQAWVAILTGRFRQSRRQVSELLQELCVVNISLGSVQTLCEETSEALVAPYQEVQEAVTQATMAQVDETGWKEKGKRHWLWVAVTNVATLFLISCSRGKKALQELIEEHFQGIVHSDRWSAYALVDSTRRQRCWAHLKRDFQALSERKTRAGPLGAYSDRFRPSIPE